MTAAPESKEYDQIALGKLTRVFGAAEGVAIHARTLKTMGRDRLDTADDLYRFANTLSRMADPIANAVGGLLGVTALLHGASGELH